jgi:hypothetical protein
LTFACNAACFSLILANLSGHGQLPAGRGFGHGAAGEYSPPRDGESHADVPLLRCPLGVSSNACGWRRRRGGCQGRRAYVLLDWLGGGIGREEEGNAAKKMMERREVPWASGDSCGEGWVGRGQILWWRRHIHGQQRDGSNRPAPKKRQPRL